MTRRPPRVSIGLPVYNGERYLREAVESILGQTFEDFELILADNASTDGTADICRAYAAADSRIRYVRNDTNIGVYRNCNRVIQLSTGEYFKLAAADDVCHQQLVARCVDVLEADATIVAAYSRTRFMDDSGNWLALSDPGWHLMSENRRERLRYVIASVHWVNVFFGLTRASDLARTRLFPLYAGGDWRLLGELSLRGKFFEIPEYLFFRRIHANASSQNTDLEWQSKFFKGRRGSVELPLWHVSADHLRTILRSDLNGGDKWSCIGCMGRRMVSRRRRLVGELQAAATYCVRQVLQESWGSPKSPREHA
jgi:glycosyltransferase involved in cell wall biosynthesis